MLVGLSVLVYVGMVLEVLVSGVWVWGTGTMDLVVVVVVDFSLLFQIVLKCIVGSGVVCCSMVVVLK